MPEDKNLSTGIKESVKIEVLPKTLVFERDGKELSFSFAAPNTGIILRDKTNNKELSWIMTDHPYLPDSFIATIQNNLHGQTNTHFHFHTKEGSHKVWFEQNDEENFTLNIQPVTKSEDQISMKLTRGEMKKMVDHYHSLFYPESSS